MATVFNARTSDAATVVSGTVTDIINAAHHGAQKVNKETNQAVRREVTSQTDQDTGKVIYVTKQSMSTVGTLAKAPFVGLNEQSAMDLVSKRSAELSAGAYAYTNAAGYDMTNPLDKIEEVKIGKASYVDNISPDIINKHIDSSTLTFKVDSPAQCLRPDYSKEFAHGVQELRTKTSLDLASSIYTSQRRSGNKVTPSATAAAKEGFKRYLNGISPDKAINKQLGNLEDANNILNQAQRAKAAMPKALGMSVFRLASIPLQKTETMKGLNLGTTTLRTSMLVEKACVRPVTNLGYNVGVRITNKIATSLANKGVKSKLVNNIAAKPLERVKFKQLASHNPLTRAIITAPRKAIGSMNYKVAANIFKKLGMKNAQSYMLARKSLLKNSYGKMGKNFYKAEIKAVRQKALEAAASKSKLASKVLEAQSKRVAHLSAFKGGKVYKTMDRFNPFKAISRLFTKLKDMLKDALKMLVKPALAVAGGITVLIAFMYFITLCAYCIDLVWGRILSPFTLSESKQFHNDAKAVFKEIQLCHEEFIEGKNEYEGCGIEDMYNKKGVKAVDFIYPNGTKENYKEVWSGVSVMTQGGIGKSDYRAGDLKFVADYVYKQTHKLSSRDYPFVENNGVTGTGTHVYIDILRGEGFAYEILALEDTDVTGEYPTIEFNKNDWMNIVKGVKRAVASTGKGYNSNDTAKIIANSEFWDVRLDGSGYVSACLRLYGSININSRNLSRYDLRTRPFLNGFTKMSFTGWESLKPGDIIVSDKSCGVFACTVGNYHYVYDNSDGGKLVSATPSTDNSLTKYTVVWRPVNPGDTGTMLTDEEWTEDEKKFEETLINVHPLFSNMPEMNEETLNEDGYVVSMKATLSAIADDPEIFSNATYDGTMKNHLMETKKSTKSLSSLDFIKYVYAQHGIRVPVDSERAITSMGDACAFDTEYLLPGDLVWYIPLDPKLDKSLAIAYERLNGALSTMGTDYSFKTEPENEGEEGIEIHLGEACMNETIPLIYMGDGKFISYGHNVLQPIYEFTAEGGYQTTSNRASVYVYKFEDLSRERVWKCVRPTGGTVRPVYGAQNYFEGWTDSNVTALMVLINDKCWNYKKADMTQKGEFLDGEDAELDWSWYEEGNFKTENDSWKFYSSNDHIANVRTDVCQDLMTYYDQYGILPGAGFALSCALSDVMTTEESLLYYNIFELYADDNATEAAEVLKYVYDSFGNATEEVHSYRKYTNYHDAIKDYANEIKNSGAIGLNDVLGGRNEISVDVHDTHTSVKQLNDMWLKGLITSQAADRASRYLASFRFQGLTDVIEKYDNIARERREYMENADMLNRKAFEVAGTLSAAGHPERDMYYELCTLITNYGDQIEKLQKIDQKNGTSTSYSQAVIRRYNESIDSLKSVAKEAYARYDAAPAEDYMDYYECHGYIPTISIGKFGAIVNIPALEHCTDAGLPNHSANAECPGNGSHTAHKEEWIEMSKHW